MITSRVGWLDDLTAWLRDTIVKAFKALADLLSDFGLAIWETLLDIVAVAIDAIPMPEFLTQTSICGLLNSAGPEVAWVVGILHLPEAFTMLTAAVTFRLLRKALTLFQW